MPLGILCSYFHCSSRIGSNLSMLCRRVVLICVSCLCLQPLSLLAWAQALPLSIRVHTESGAEIAGATIRVEHDGKLSANALTDRAGKASIEGLALAQYNILVSAEPFDTGL